MAIEEDICEHFRKSADKNLNSIFTAGTSKSSEGIFTVEKLHAMMDAIKDVKVPVPDGLKKPVDIPPAIWQTPINLCPEDLEPLPEPKLKIRDSVPMSDEFRAEMNKWLLDMFGRREKIDYKMRLLGMTLSGPALKYPGMFAYDVCPC